MNEQSSRPHWEADTATAAPTATAVQEPLPQQAWAPPPPATPRRGLGDRWRGAPRAARWGALTVAALVLLLGVAIGSFALGRASAPERGTDGGTDPTDVDPGGRFGDRPDLDGGPGAPGAPGDQGVPPALPDQGTAPDGTLPDGTAPDQGSLPDDGSGSGTTQSSWWVVPTPTSVTAA